MPTSSAPGIPARSERGDSTTLLPPRWLTDVCSNGARHLVFLDELNCAPGAVMAAMLRLVNERAVHDMVMPESTVIAAAGNDPEHVPAASDLSPSMQSRFAHIEWTALHGSDALAAHAQGYPVPRIAAPDPAAVASESDRWRAVLAAFVTAHPVHSEDLTANAGRAAAAGRGYPTPRTWDMAATALGWATAAGLASATHLEVASALVGRAAAVEALAYADSLDLPDPESWIADPDAAEPLGRSDRTLAALGAVAAAVARTVRDGGTDEDANTRLANGLLAVARVAEMSETATAYPAVRMLLNLYVTTPPLTVPIEVVDRIGAVFSDYLNLDATLTQRGIALDA